MGRPPIDPTKTNKNFRLGRKTLDGLAAIAAEHARRTGKMPTHTAAVEWAVAELRARIELEKKAARSKTPVIGTVGPMVPPT